MKRVLLVYFSQTGQLERIARQFVAPLVDAPDIEVIHENLRPRQPYPFPWPIWKFFDAMPETVTLQPPALEELSVRADDEFDLVILAYQVWFLMPAGPITAFLKSETGRQLLRGRSVVTVIGCRNMWMMAQETVKRLVADAGGVLCDNVVFTDRSGTLASFITTPRWLLTGRRDAFWNFPAAGVAEEAIASAERFGRALCNGLRADIERTGSPMLSGLGAVFADPRLIFSERAGQRAFRVWSKLIRLGGPPGAVARLPLLALFCLYLIVIIVTLVPTSLFLQWLMRPLLARRLKGLAEYFERPSGR